MADATGGGAMRIVSAVEPDFRALRRQLDQRPVVRRCRRAGHSTVRRPCSIAASLAPAATGAAQSRNRGRGVFDLMAADQIRQRQVEQAVGILIDHAPVFRWAKKSCPNT